MAAIHQARDMSNLAQAGRVEHKGNRPRGRTAGSHIHDMVALGKAVVLTEAEARKFNAKAVGYATSPHMPRVSGYSDASGEWCSSNGILFLKKD